MIESKPVSAKLKYGLLFLIVAATFICYSPSLSNQFTNWDDNLYVADNPYIKYLTADNLKMVLLHNITNNYYHPITMLSIAANYHFSQMQPFGYYFTNIILHIINSCLVFLLIIMLFDAMQEKGYGTINHKELFAVIGALFFAIHPMHVESVSWLAERKDQLYALFYFLGLMAYVKYVRVQKFTWLIWVTVLYLCSLLSKPMAIVFPLSLFTIDILLKRKLNIRGIAEKVPMLIIAAVSAIMTFKSVVSANAVQEYHSFSFIPRFLIASYSFVIYLVKAIVPFHLSAFYPYPELTSNGGLPVLFYIMPLVAIIITGLLVYLAYRSNNNALRVVLFGLSFFLVNVVLILQIVSSGPTMMSERYTYVAYFGLFFIVVYFLNSLWQKYGLAVSVLAIGGILVLGTVCFSRTLVWQNNETLWQDVIKKYPDRVELAYNSLGSYYMDKGDIDLAYTYYKKAVEMHSGDAKVYSNIANIYAMRKDYWDAFSAYNMGLKLDSNDFVIYLDRGVTYSILGKYDSAELDYMHAYKIDPNSEKLLNARAYNYLEEDKYEKAITDYNRLININPNQPLYYQKLAVAEANMGDTARAFTDFDHSLKLNPNNGDCLFDMSLAYKKQKNYAKALEFATKARQAGYKVPDSYISNLQQSVNSSVK